MAEKGGFRSAAAAAAAVLVGWSLLGTKSVPADEGEKAEEQDDGRGRLARRPTAIPMAGWKDILRRTFGQLGKDRVMLIAAGVTFYALLALFPAMTALVSIYGIFADPQTVVDHVDTMSGVMPEGAVEIIGGQLERIAGQPAGSLGVGFIVGLVIALWSANNGMKAIFQATNVAYNEQEKRSFFRVTALTFMFTLGAIFVLILTLGAIVVVPVVLGFLGLEGWTATILQYARWPLLFLVITGGISLIYRWGPSRRPATWRWILPGSTVAAVIWLAVSLLFSWYVASFDSYNETYGSLGAVIAFMVWIWVSATIIIMGAELNSETERQTRIDTTTARGAPMGKRGAQAADTLGQRMDE